jgi:ribosomal protein S19
MSHAFAPLAITGNAVCFYIGSGGLLSGAIFFVTVLSLLILFLVSRLNCCRPTKKFVKTATRAYLVLPVALADIGLLIYLYEGIQNLIGFISVLVVLVVVGVMIWSSFINYRFRAGHKKYPSRAKINFLSVLVPIVYLILLICLELILPVGLLAAVFVVTYGAFAVISTPMALYCCKYN